MCFLRDNFFQTNRENEDIIKDIGIYPYPDRYLKKDFMC